MTSRNFDEKMKLSRFSSRRDSHVYVIQGSAFIDQNNKGNHSELYTNSWYIRK